MVVSRNSTAMGSSSRGSSVVNDANVVDYLKLNECKILQSGSA
jgi:hypothetical protein